MTTRRCMAVMTCAALVYIVASATDTTASIVAVDSLSAVATALAWWGARRQPQRGRRPWGLIAVGLTLWLVGDVIWDSFTIVNGEVPLHSLADAAYLLAYPVLTAGIVSMIRHRAPDHWRAGLLDAVGVAMASSLAAWVFLVPVTSADAPIDQFLTIAYPLGDVILLAALAWLVLSPGIRGLPSVLALAGVITTLTLDVLVSIGPVVDHPVLGRWFDNGYPLGYLFIALAACHTRSAELTLPDPSPSDRLQPARIVFLGVALFSGPVIGTFTGSSGGAHRVLVLITTIGIGSIVFARFIAALRELEQSRVAISLVAGTDVLTGLDNRRRFLASGERCLERLHRESKPVAALMIDIDHFKHINDTHGHASGDAVLVELARRCASAIRPFDLVGRLGGDEFAMILPDCSETETRRVVARLQELVAAEPFALAAGAGDPIVVTLSIGAASGSFATMQAALAEADAALYEAKRRGRDRMWLAGSRTSIDA